MTEVIIPYTKTKTSLRELDFDRYFCMAAICYSGRILVSTNEQLLRHVKNFSTFKQHRIWSATMTFYFEFPAESWFDINPDKAILIYLSSGYYFYNTSTANKPLPEYASILWCRSPIDPLTHSNIAYQPSVHVKNRRWKLFNVYFKKYSLKSYRLWVNHNPNFRDFCLPFGIRCIICADNITTTFSKLL